MTFMLTLGLCLGILAQVWCHPPNNDDFFQSGFPMGSNCGNSHFCMTNFNVNVTEKIYPSCPPNTDCISCRFGGRWGWWRRPCPSCCDNPVIVSKIVQKNRTVCCPGYFGWNCDKAFCAKPCLDNKTNCIAPNKCGPVIQCDDSIEKQCQNGGTCFYGICACPRGYGGVFCETEMCNPPCQNGGICVEQTCRCTNAFTGNFCQIAPESPGRIDRVEKSRRLPNLDVIQTVRYVRRQPNNVLRVYIKDQRIDAASDEIKARWCVDTGRASFIPAALLTPTVSAVGLVDGGDGGEGDPVLVIISKIVQKNRTVCCPGYFGWNCDKAFCAKPCLDNKTNCIAPNKCGPVIQCDDSIEKQCQNGGTCFYGICACPRGYGGVFCETEMCDPPCQNGGICVEQTCRCTNAFTGNICQIAPDTVMP
ncbi:hypothetical protein LSH36_95g08035 [Paralvinella palmiformis]|uniref:EGF-like domain-containing protein n=1 Tax=Paralvinella palmiformis TaxID=53620 RepID=A0AAD9K0E4_9ANNE|nr:hypothetical protein LSH36_95g08035 [Paralvinella palmiformis]